MRGINKAIIVGSLGNDPETKWTQGGTAVTKISVATEFKTKDGEAKVSWHRVTFFGKLAEVAGEYLRKGSQIYVEGRINYSEHTGDDGQKRYYTDIIADQMQMLGGGGDRDGSTGGDRGGSTRGAPSRQQAKHGAQRGSAQKAPVSEYEAGGFDDAPF